MTEDHRLLKIDILIQQRKFADAERILAELIAEETQNISYLALLAEVNLLQNKLDVATDIIDNAIGLAPDSSFLFYVKARIEMQCDRLSEAEMFIDQAISLDPMDAEYFALMANIKLARKKFDEALSYANRALEIDAENLLALNTRSTALIKLDRSEESFETIEGALREDPNNAFTHANYGWGLLEKGDHKKALEHFKEALTHSPTLEYAQAGMLEAIKASNPIYRLFLRYAFWMGNMTDKFQWGFIIVFYLVFRALRSAAQRNPEVEPYLTPIIIALALIAFTTWIITPISNLFLRFNKYGRLLLDEKEKMSSNLVAGSFGVFVIGLLLYLFFFDIKYLYIAVFGFVMMLPLSVIFAPAKYKNSLLIYTVLLALIGIYAIIQTFATGEMFNGATILFALGFFGFQILANYMMIKEDNR